MDMGDFVDSDAGGRKDLRLYNIEHTDEGGMALIHLLCRDESGKRYHIEVQDFLPHFYVEDSEITTGLRNHVLTKDVETGTTKSLRGESLGTVYTQTSDDMKAIKNDFYNTYEADVSFTKRFVINKDIYTSVNVPLENTVATESGRLIEPIYGDYRISSNDVVGDGTSPKSRNDSNRSSRKVVGDSSPSSRSESRPETHEVDVAPRMVIFDIETSDSNGFPHAHLAEEPVTVVTAYDSYDKAYSVWLLENALWNAQQRSEIRGVIEARDDVDHFEMYERESELLNEFNLWVGDKEADYISGWNSDGYDVPYILNRSANLATYTYTTWSPVGEAYTSRDGERAYIKGLTLFDMLKGYKKTQIHELKNDKLDTVAKAELDKGKVELSGSFDEEWENRPDDFVRYSVRDVESVVEIQQKKEIAQTFSHMQAVTGAHIGEMISANYGLIDTYFLRLAHEEGYALPTATPPEEDWYFGGHVFLPQAGLHEDVVYPDLASLYPNMMAQCNMSPETLVGTQSDLNHSDYDKSDCVWSWIDTRPVKRVEYGEPYKHHQDGTYKAIMRKDKDGNYKTAWADDPEPQRLYYLSASVKEGFVASGIKKLLDMKYEYKGTDMYAAIKAVVNSCYGVFGDSNTGKTGFRLFDVRLAESITLGGQAVVKYTDKRFAQHAADIKAEQGICGDEPYRVGGDTDSVMTALPFDLSDMEIVTVAEEAAERVGEDYDTFCKDHFGLDEHLMETEVESYSPRCFVPMDTKQSDPTVGSKKRYVTLVTIEDGEVLDEPELNIKGFEAVRSDVADLTVELQKETFNYLMYDDPVEAKDETYDLVKDAVENIKDGSMPIEKLGIPSSIGKDLSTYGTENRTPQPQYRGARYANQNIYGSEVLSEGAKPLRYPIDRVPRDYPETYRADTAEDGTVVDWIAVDEPQDIPEGFEMDTDEIVKKTVRGPLDRIFATMQWSHSDAISDSTATELSAFM